MDINELKEWVESNAKSFMPKESFTQEELGHIAMCLHHIHLWYHEDYPIGDFLTAVVRNDFTEVCFRADDINRRALIIYVMFLANRIPSGWRKKALAEAGGK